MGYRIYILAVVITLTLSLSQSSCSEDILFGEPFRQYADAVLGFSSQYGSTNWSAARALGREEVYPEHYDDIRAWASLTPDDYREYLVLGFDSVQTVTRIEIYETYYPGAIDTVYLRSKGEFVRVYAGKAEVPEIPNESRIFVIDVNPPVFAVDAIRIELDSPEVPGWNEIDAVAISGRFTEKQE